MVGVGDIFVAKWGYDQTNADFFQVVGVTKSSVKVRHLKSKETKNVDDAGFDTMTGSVVPLKGRFDGGVMTKRIKIWYDDEVFDAGDSMGFAKKWDGQPVWVSHYA